MFTSAKDCDTPPWNLESHMLRLPYLAHEYDHDIKQRHYITGTRSHSGYRKATSEDTTSLLVRLVPERAEFPSVDTTVQHIQFTNSSKKSHLTLGLFNNALNIMDLTSCERQARIHSLEFKYQNGVHQVDLLNKSEETRRLKLQLLYSRDNNAVLKDKLSQKDAQYRHLMKQRDQLLGDLDNTKETTRIQDSKLKKQAIDLANLNAEIESLGSHIEDSGKVLQDKFALTRELEKLRPENEHLQSQLANYQQVIAEKHSLQRQVDSLEVELENEKRSRQRAQDKENRSLTDELKSRAEDAEKRLLSEKREREKIKKEHEKALTEANTYRERLGERISTMKSKHKDLQTELKDAKMELERYRREERTRTTEHRPKKPTTLNSQTVKKRHMDESDFEEVTIQTPGNEDQMERRPTKKRGGEHASLGEKSTFSVTPFLSRNKSMSDEPCEAQTPEASTDMVPAPGTVAAVEQVESPHPASPFEEPRAVANPSKAKTMAKSNASKPQKPRGRPRKNPLAEVASSKQNEVNQQQSTKAESSLEQAVEDIPSTVDQENAAVLDAKSPSELNDMPKSQTHETHHLELGRASRTSVPHNVDGKKKRRKLLGNTDTTIFDDDGEAEPLPVKVPTGQTAKRRRAPLGGAPSAFAGASFSPLKRDRRGVGASFLA